MAQKSFKLIIYSMVCIVMHCCQNKNFPSENLSMPELKNTVVFEILNTSLFYSWNADLEFQPQILKFKLINKSNQAYALSINDDLPFPYSNYEMYYKNRDYYFEDHSNSPLLRIFEKNNTIVNFDLGVLLDLSEILKVDTLVGSSNKFVENMIVLNPHEEKLMEMKISLPTMFVENFESEGKVFKDYVFTYDMFELDGYTADLFMILDSSWIKKVPEEKTAEFQKNNIKMFTGTISSNKIPVLLKGGSPHEQNEENSERKNVNE
ncbi:MAG: hypothetical protein WBF63_09185 [Moheibacter sp.]